MNIHKNLIKIQIVAFTYHKLVIAYGTNRNYLVIISWKSQKTTKPYFYLTLGIWPNQRNLNNKCEQMNEKYFFFEFRIYEFNLFIKFL